MSMTQTRIKQVQGFMEEARQKLWDELLKHKQLCDAADEAERAKAASWERCDAVHKTMEAYEERLEELLEELRAEQKS